MQYDTAGIKPEIRFDSFVFTGTGKEIYVIFLP
jgi:hypothetical protein